MIRLLRGDCRETLATLAPGSVQACVTSPPYWGLRSYGTPDLVWGGDAAHRHEWLTRELRSLTAGQTAKQVTNAGSFREATPYGTCACGAWRGSLGLEPAPELFVEHIVECFRAVKRVLRDDGVIFVNMGDSYAGSGKGPSNGVQPDASQIGPSARKARGMNNLQDTPTAWIPVGAGYKAKDLMEIPSMVAQALRADGWYLRSRIPWLKRNAMPESVTDRPASSVEYVFLLSKSARYFWDADAVRSIAKNEGYVRKAAKSKHRDGANDGNDHRAIIGFVERDVEVHGRNRRNGDWFFESWQGMLLDEQDDPLALVVNPAPLKIAHYASFPPKLVEPIVKASTSEKGQCPECGAPWARVVEKSGGTIGTSWHNHDDDLGRGMRGGDNGTNVAAEGYKTYRVESKGWQPTCAHSGDPVPCVVVDPFAGSGTTLMVADRLGRNAIGCELSESYSDMGTARVVGDAPMFVQMEGGASMPLAEPIVDKQSALGKRTYSGFNARWDAKEKDSG